jgi:hypothetical protein
MLYSIRFDASNVAAGAVGPSGTGSFLYDAELDGGTMTGLNWDFGNGRAGGVTDTQLASRFSVNPTEGHFIFANIFDHTHLDPGAYGGSVGYSPLNANQLYGTFPGPAQSDPEAGAVIFCYLSYARWPNDSCEIPLLVRTMDVAEYSFRFLNVNQQFETWRGLVLVSAAPIPAAAWLLLTAICPLGWLQWKSARA